MSLHPVVRALRWPASLLFGMAVRLRAWLYRRGIFPQLRLNGVVISVGNLTTGGTGKTPMVIWLAERLLAEGRRVGILTRGYHGAEGGSDEVSVFRRRLGDRVKIGVGADRFAAGRALESEGVEYWLVDDGFQHLRLARDADIVLVDATDPFGGGHLLPAGHLREPRSALVRADLVVITRSDHSPALEAVLRRHPKAPVFYAQTARGNIPEDWGTKKCFAFCAIGNPGAFFDDLRRWGVTLAGTRAFHDHHRFTQAERQAIEQEARRAGADLLVCTEKDIYNLGDTVGRMDLVVCAISLQVSAPDEFWRELRAVLERRRGEAGR